ncbi:MAG: PHP domain-containing protein [Clostridia bacterium]|nr:PHP domain-containing protein [Clostridia bacterium]
MAFWGDYHTHTEYSHGKGTVEDNVQAGIARGLKAVAITDHGITGYPHNLHPAYFEDFLADVESVRLAHPEINLLSGIEANLISGKGDLDLTEVEQEKLDFIICGFHQVRIPDKADFFFDFWLPNFLPIKNRRSRIMKNTDAYVNAVQRYRVGVIAHPLRSIGCDLRVIGELAKEYGVYVELNSKKCQLSPQDFETLGKTGCEFIVNSDAHEPERVGDFSAVELFDQAGLDRKLIANWNRFPTFR